MSENLLDPKPKAILHAYSRELGRCSPAFGLTIEELRASERLGGSVTEGYLRLVQNAIDSGQGIEDIKSQAPDQIMRLLELEFRGINPDGEDELDIALKKQPSPRPRR